MSSRHDDDPLRAADAWFLANGLLVLAALGGYSEWGVFDPETRRLTGRPAGWRASGYTPSADGWDEFKGYYQGRTEVPG